MSCCTFFQTELATVSSIFVAIRDVRRHVVTVIQVTSRWGVSASRRHRRQDGWTSTPHACGDEQAGERLLKQRPKVQVRALVGYLLFRVSRISLFSLSFSLFLSLMQQRQRNAAVRAMTPKSQRWEQCGGPLVVSLAPEKLAGHGRGTTIYASTITADCTRGPSYQCRRDGGWMWMHAVLEAGNVKRAQKYRVVSVESAVKWPLCGSYWNYSTNLTVRAFSRTRVCQTTCCNYA